jgi:hypothetical protein
MPDRDADPEESKGDEPDWRRLLDGYAEPGRLRRLRDHQRRKKSSRLRRLLRWVFFRSGRRR